MNTLLGAPFEQTLVLHLMEDISLPESSIVFRRRLAHCLSIRGLISILKENDTIYWVRLTC